MVRDREQEEKRRHRELLGNILIQSDVISGRNHVNRIKNDAQKIGLITQQHRKLNLQIIAAITNDLLTLLRDDIYPMTDPKACYAPEPAIESLQALFTLITELIALEDLNRIKRYLYLRTLSEACDEANENIYLKKVQDLLALFQQQVSVHPGHIKTWQELSIWLTGVYWSIAERVSAEERNASLKQQGNHLVTDIEDRLLLSYLGVTKLDIFEYFLHIANEVTQATRVDYRAHPAQESRAHFTRHPHTLFNKPVIINTELEAFSCPITFELMRRAMFCTLDGHAYEEKDVRNHLNSKRFAPLNNVKMQKGQSVEEVLKPHATLREILKKFKEGTLQANQFYCPLGKRPLTRAVFCLLNNTSYDEDAIREYLDKHHETPDKIPLRNGARIDQVLVTDYTLRDLVTELLGQEAKPKPAI